jgi:hypothetical protein
MNNKDEMIYFIINLLKNNQENDLKNLYYSGYFSDLFHEYFDLTDISSEKIKIMLKNIKGKVDDADFISIVYLFRRYMRIDIQSGKIMVDLVNTQNSKPVNLMRTHTADLLDNTLLLIRNRFYLSQLLTAKSLDILENLLFIQKNDSSKYILCLIEWLEFLQKHIKSEKNDLSRKDIIFLDKYSIEIRRDFIDIYDFVFSDK